MTENTEHEDCRIKGWYWVWALLQKVAPHISKPTGLETVEARMAWLLDKAGAAEWVEHSKAAGWQAMAEGIAGGYLLSVGVADTNPSRRTRLANAIVAAMNAAAADTRAEIAERNSSAASEDLTGSVETNEPAPETGVTIRDAVPSTHLLPIGYLTKAALADLNEVRDDNPDEVNEDFPVVASVVLSDCNGAYTEAVFANADVLAMEQELMRARQTLKVHGIRSDQAGLAFASEHRKAVHYHALLCRAMRMLKRAASFSAGIDVDDVAEITALADTMPEPDADEPSWDEVIEDLYVINHMALPVPADKAEALRKLLALEVGIALDPSVSSSARDLIRRGHDEALARASWSFMGHLIRQRGWSEQTFGPGPRVRGVTDHIRKELVEIEASNGTDLTEWIDVVLLACDGAWRSGATPAAIITALRDKLAKNMARKWPDWRGVDTDKAIEHVREPGEAQSRGRTEVVALKADVEARAKALYEAHVAGVEGLPQTWEEALVYPLAPFSGGAFARGWREKARLELIDERKITCGECGNTGVHKLSCSRARQAITPRDASAPAWCEGCGEPWPSHKPGCGEDKR